MEKDNDIALEIAGISKKFAKGFASLIKYGLTDIARNTVGLSLESDRLRPGEFWAVKDVTLDLKRGETLGVIGPNGSGKTTLLKMVNGIIAPDKGKITIRGRVGALIAVGAGFHPLLSGRENIYVNGVILGMSKEEIDSKFKQIVDFADIGDFLDSPVKHYSSGMYVRLGLAIAVHADPDILLVDEVLSVGDANFQAKSFRKMEEILTRGTTVIFVSHNTIMIERICKRTLLLDKGKVEYLGETRKAIDRYYEIAAVDRETGKKYDTFIYKAEVKTEKKWTQLRFKLRANKPLSRSKFVIIGYKNMNKVFHLVSGAMNFEPGEHEVELVFDHSLLTRGIYKLTVRLRDSRSHLKTYAVQHDFANVRLKQGKKALDLGVGRYEDTGIILQTNKERARLVKK